MFLFSFICLWPCFLLFSFIVSLSCGVTVNAQKREHARVSLMRVANRSLLFKKSHLTMNEKYEKESNMTNNTCLGVNEPLLTHCMSICR